LNELVDQSWYQEMIRDIKTHTHFKIIEAKHYFGKRISEERQRQKIEEGDFYFIEQVSEDLQTSKSEIYRCIQFYKKYPELSPNQRQLSWDYIKKKELPTPKKRKFQPPPLPDKKYGVIYADPPWEYDTPESSRAIDDHYPVLNKQELCWMGDKVQEITEDDCVLYMWATTARLNWAFSVIESWGFKYKTSMVWDKIKHNLGHYCSARHEILLIGGKGKSKPFDSKLANSIDSVQQIEKDSQHSKKPILFYQIIEELYPGKKKIELFIGNPNDPRPGWDYWPQENMRQKRNMS
jgi:N6-adenosine-specific RNA methylase IME4